MIIDKNLVHLFQNYSCTTFKRGKIKICVGLYVGSHLSSDVQEICKNERAASDLQLKTYFKINLPQKLFRKILKWVHGTFPSSLALPETNVGMGQKYIF